jgi:prepilin-type N-terminal cleavage/methylation domain-containing protein
VATSLQKQKRAFSLVELLVAIAVLLLLIAMMAQITDGAAKSVTIGGRRMDADTQARMIFDRLAIDLSRMLKRSDLDYSTFKQPASQLPSRFTSGQPVTFPANPQLGNDRFAFYSETSGYFPGSTRPSGNQKSLVSLVAWQMGSDTASGTPALLRMGLGMGWEPGPSGAWNSISFLPSTLLSVWPGLFTDVSEYKAVGDQVFRVEYAYLLKARGSTAARLSIVPWDTDPTLSPAHTSVDGFRDVAAIVVTLAILDTSSRILVNDYSALVDAFPDAAVGSSGHVDDVGRSWMQIANAPGFGASVGFPQQSAAHVRIYERYFYLDSLR